MPVQFWPSGVSWTAAELNAWVNSGTEPANLTQLGRDKLMEWRRWRKVANYCLNTWTTATAAAQVWFKLGSGTPDAGQEQEVTEIRQSILDTQANIALHGFMDSHWGFLDMMRYAVMSVDISPAKIREYMAPPVDPTNEFSPRETFTRRSVVLDWRNLPGVGAGVIATIEDPAQILAPATFRARTYTQAEVTTVLTEIDNPGEVPAP